jgi:hypothetical protein
MWSHRLPLSATGRFAAAACVLASTLFSVSDRSAAFSQLASKREAARDIVRIQTGGPKLTGAWVSKTDEQFEIAHTDDTVEMTFSGPTPASRKGKISGSFDGAVFAGAYEATDGSTTDRGVVRFLRNPDGTLEGSWRSLVTGRQGNWSLTKK